MVANSVFRDQSSPIHNVGIISEHKDAGVGEFDGSLMGSKVCGHEEPALFTVHVFSR